MADIDKTLKYYNENAQSFASGTVSVKFTKVQDKFLEKLNPDAYILDFGCGAGRDTKYFLSRGYQVDAVDGSEQLCRIASEYTEIKVRQMLFQELDEKEKYDSILSSLSKNLIVKNVDVTSHPTIKGELMLISSAINPTYTMREKLGTGSFVNITPSTSTSTPIITPIYINSTTTITPDSSGYYDPDSNPVTTPNYYFYKVNFVYSSPN